MVRIRFVFAAWCAAGAVACGGGGDSPTPPPMPAVPIVAPPVAQPVPAQPAEPPELVAARKPGSIAEPCMNRFSRAREIRDRYLSMVDREDGPSERSRGISYGIFHLPATSLPACKEALTRATAMTPALPAFDDAARAYGVALEALLPVLEDATTYYQRETFRDDAYAHGRELHPRLLAALDAFVTAEDALGDQASAIERAASEVQLRILEADPSKRGEFLIERTRARAASLMRLVEAVRVEPHPRERRMAHLVSTDAAAIGAAVTELETAVDAMRTGSPADSVDTGGSYRTDANDLVAKALVVSRAIRDDEALNEGAAVDLLNGLIGEYNDLVGDYNRLSF